MADVTGNKWQKDNYNLNILTPTWLPHNDAAHRICSKIVDEYDLQVDGAIGGRYQLVVASLLLAARQTLTSDLRDGKSIFLGCPRNNNYWSNYPGVGQKIILEVVDRLDGELIYKRQDSGQRVFYVTEWGNTAYDGITTMYEVDTVLLEDDDFNMAEYIEVGREAVKVNKAESVWQHKIRKRNNRPKPRYGKAEAKKAFKAPLVKHVREVEELNTFWQQHPLELAEGSWAASATRVFHNGRLDAGGRFYGLWTGRDNFLRLQSRIDGEAVCSIDINASQPVLFSGLMGVKLKDRDSWEDLYSEIADNLDNKPDEVSQVRSILKRVGMELVGTGNSFKAKPSDELVKDTGITQNQWEEYRSALIEHIPALELMDGDHLNGAGIISYHESQMMLQSIQTLMASGIPSYPVHDCLIVKASDKDTALQVFRNTIRSYIFNYSSGRIDVMVAVSIEEYDSKTRIVGYYS